VWTGEAEWYADLLGPRVSRGPTGSEQVREMTAQRYLDWNLATAYSNIRECSLEKSQEDG
jgi:hypothetical protein